MTAAFEWKPDPPLLETLITLAQQKGRSPESIITEAVALYLQMQDISSGDRQDDPLIGLFSGSANLATRSEDILSQDITSESGWTWKQPLS